MTRVYNFSAGPAALRNRCCQAAAEMLDWQGSGMSVMEMSHRGKEFMSIHAEALHLLRELLDAGQLQDPLHGGGAIAENAIVPMNLLRNTPAPTGRHRRVVQALDPGSGQNTARSTSRRAAAPAAPHPAARELEARPNAAYVHICANETIGGVEYHFTPEVGDVPLVADVSSNILARPLDVSKYGLIYGGAQKNIGPPA